MHIGIDFDNTIVCYADLFHRAAVERNLIPCEVPRFKDAVRDYLRGQGREDSWTELQGVVYGVWIEQAAAYGGVLEFLGECHRRGIPRSIISHRTRRPYGGAEIDLHRAARDWLAKNLFRDGEQPTLIQPQQVYFEATRQAKLRRIAESGCTWFIDDLPEFLVNPAFPPGVRRILFDPHDRHAGRIQHERAASWAEITRLVCEEFRS